MPSETSHASFGHAALVADLRAVRERGLLRLHEVDLPALSAAAMALGLPVGDDRVRSSLTRVIERAATGLAGNLDTATAYTFGLVPGTRDWPAQDRRSRAAAVYGVSVERFRKRQERLVIDNLAQRILDLCPAALPDTGGVPLGGSVEVSVPAGEVTLHRKPVETLHGVDVLVSSENVYLEMSKTFRSTFSASLRSAAATRDAMGAISKDVLQDELHEWLRKEGREGIPLLAGTVVPTSPGELRAQGVKRVYHAAVAVPRPRTDTYDVEASAVVRAVRNVFALARDERARHEPSLRSLCFPVFGAGRGGLPPHTAFAYLWGALEPEMRSGEWDVHLIARSAATAEAVMKGLRARDRERTALP
ncbi:macro domain-containing protein [Spirillospora sp. NPDC048832]